MSSGSDTASVTLDELGEAKVQFETTKQPGDNFRVAVALKETDLGSTNLQVTYPLKKGFVEYDSAARAKTANVALSPLLTVWRRLWCEFDSMEAIPISGIEKTSTKERLLRSQEPRSL